MGKVNFMQIDPMTFSEFLLANDDANLAVYLDSVDTLEPIPDAFFNPLYEKLKMYYVTGGMPEAVQMWTEARDVSARFPSPKAVGASCARRRSNPTSTKYILNADRSS